MCNNSFHFACFKPQFFSLKIFFTVFFLVHSFIHLPIKVIIFQTPYMYNVYESIAFKSNTNELQRSCHTQFASLWRQSTLKIIYAWRQKKKLWILDGTQSMFNFSEFLTCLDLLNCSQPKITICTLYTVHIQQAHFCSSIFWCCVQNIEVQFMFCLLSIALMSSNWSFANLRVRLHRTVTSIKGNFQGDLYIF